MPHHARKAHTRPPTDDRSEEWHRVRASRDTDEICPDVQSLIRLRASLNSLINVATFLRTSESLSARVRPSLTVEAQDALRPSTGLLNGIIEAERHCRFRMYLFGESFRSRSRRHRLVDLLHHRVCLQIGLCHCKLRRSASGRACRSRSPLSCSVLPARSASSDRVDVVSSANVFEVSGRRSLGGQHEH